MKFLHKNFFYVTMVIRCGGVFMDVETLWNNFLADIKENISSLSYDTWFRDTKLVSLHNNVATIIVPMPVHKKHLIDNYKDVIEDKLIGLTGSSFSLNFLLHDEWDAIKDDFGRETQKKAEKKEKKQEKEIILSEQTFEDANLNKEYTFNNFIVGSSNRFAYTASMALAGIA